MSATPSRAGGGSRAGDDARVIVSIAQRDSRVRLGFDEVTLIPAPATA